MATTNRNNHHAAITMRVSGSEVRTAGVVRAPTEADWCSARSPGRWLRLGPYRKAVAFSQTCDLVRFVSWLSAIDRPLSTGKNTTASTMPLATERSSAAIVTDSSTQENSLMAQERSANPTFSQATTGSPCNVDSEPV